MIREAFITARKVTRRKATQNDQQDSGEDEDQLVVASAVTAHAYDPEAGSDQEDDRLYCICRLPYDADKMMIACDK
jgi:hypothetical protein